LQRYTFHNSNEIQGGAQRLMLLFIIMYIISLKCMALYRWIISAWPWH